MRESINRARRLLAAALATGFLAINTVAATTFTYETFTSNGITTPYRKATIGTASTDMALVIYLHGGSSKGSDNELPVQEKGVGTIAGYLEAEGIDATLIVPQCPATLSWGGKMNTVLTDLIRRLIDGGSIDATRVFILGGSMGGTGTWSMVAANSGLFAAAMPVAGNPARICANDIAGTPIYSVMGTADSIMQIDVVQSIIDSLANLGTECRLDIEEGWTHETTCTQSYTAERLTWIFGHKRAAGNEGGLDTPLCNLPQAVRFYTLGGMSVTSPSAPGIYIRKAFAPDGSVVTDKITVTN